MGAKKFINNPDNLAAELTAGLVKSNNDILKLIDDDIIIRAHPKAAGKVQLVFAQGLGHEPGYNGFIGYGLHDVEVSGDIFACAGGDRIYEGLKIAWESSKRTPVLLLIANHEGDVINANIAMEMAKADGIDVESALLYDDIASAPKGEEANRRGMQGMVFAFKIAGALAEQGCSRDEIAEAVKQVNAQTRTLSIALESCIIPSTGKTLFSLFEDEMIIGCGVHGESGPDGPAKMMPAKDIVAKVADRLIADGEYKSGDELLVLVNNCGSTTLMELLILYNDLHEYLLAKGMTPYRPLVGNYMTTQDMAGASISFCKCDHKIKELWDYPANSPYLKKIGAN
jgi:dihydroxyacetone kinase-like protein